MEYCDEFFANLARSGIGTLVIQAKFKSPPWCGPGSWAEAKAGAMCLTGRLGPAEAKMACVQRYS